MSEAKTPSSSLGFRIGNAHCIWIRPPFWRRREAEAPSQISQKKRGKRDEPAAGSTNGKRKVQEEHAGKEIEISL
jgi:hypothetical protein